MFVAQTTLEIWIDSGLVDFTGNSVHLQKSGATYDLEPAVRFVGIVDGLQESTLLGKVLTEERIVQAGGELLGDSVMFGEVAFQVIAGFIATMCDGAGSPPEAPQ